MSTISNITLHLTRKVFNTHVPKSCDIPLKQSTSPNFVREQRYMSQTPALQSKTNGFGGNCYGPSIRHNGMKSQWRWRAMFIHKAGNLSLSSPIIAIQITSHASSQAFGCYPILLFKEEIVPFHMYSNFFSFKNHSLLSY